MNHFSLLYQTLHVGRRHAVTQSADPAEDHKNPKNCEDTSYRNLALFFLFFWFFPVRAIRDSAYGNGYVLIFAYRLVRVSQLQIRKKGREIGITVFLLDCHTLF